MTVRATGAGLARRTRRRDGARRLWLLTGAVFVMLLTTVATLTPLLHGIVWWTDAALLSAAVLAAAAGIRSLGAPRWVGTPVGALAGLAVLTLLYAPATGLVFVVPTAETFAVFGELASAGTTSIIRESTPAPATDGIRFVLACGVGVLAVLFDGLALSLRRVALTGALVVGVVVVPGIVTGDVTPWPLALCTVVFLWMLWVDARVRNPSLRLGGGMLVITAASVVGAVALSTAAPGFNGASLLTVSGDPVSSRGISPLVDLGADLRRPGSTEQFRYITDTTRPQYFRLLTLDRFDGTTWSPGDDQVTEPYSRGSVMQVPGLDASTPTETVETSVDIVGMRSEWLPVPFPSVQVTGLDGRWEWDVDGLTLSSPSSSTRGQEYVSQSLSLRPTREQLVAAPADYPESVTPYLEVPDDVPDLIETTLDEVTAGLTNAYDRAYALQQFFRAGDFRYSLDSPVDDGYDGDGYDVIARFLEEQTGYCVHFASAMAVMSRMAGIPARVSLGYLPGDRLGATEDERSRYTVTSDDLHAWPELYFSGVGWVPFEPTTGRGVIPEYALQVSANEPADEAEPDVRPVTPTPEQQPEAEEEASERTTRDESRSDLFAYTWGLAVIVLVCAAVPAVFARVRRARRLADLRRGRGLRPGRGGADLAWQMVEDAERDHGQDVPPTDTPRARAEAISERLELADAESAALHRLLDAVERHRFAPAEPDALGRGLADDAIIVTTAISRGASTPERMRALLLPASVLSPPRRSRVPHRAEG
ncbi:DUF3488 and transglutaminase-like domain-containing protein [Okibacterium endophyticum]